MRARLRAAGVMLAAAVMAAGCATERRVTDAKHPEIRITRTGGVTYRGELVDVEDLPDLLKDAGFRKRDTINVYCPDDFNDYRLQRKVLSTLARGGFTRPILVGERRSYSEAAGGGKKKR